MNRNLPDLQWIQEFAENIRPYVKVRLRDNVLIRMPNEAYKLNATGARMLHHVLEGGQIDAILEARAHDTEAPEQINSFFQDLSRVLGSRLCDRYESPSLERQPFELGYIDLPILSEIALTYKCNIRCRFCYAACHCISPDDKADSTKELTTEEFKNILEIIHRDAGVPSVSFTGGEPTLRRDLPELVAYAAQILKMRVNLITNGTLIDTAYAILLKNAGLASAQVSIESADPEIHDRLVGKNGAFTKSMKGYQALQAAEVPVHVHTTICRLNRDCLNEMPAFVKSLGGNRFSMNLVIPSGRGVESDLSISYAEIGKILEDIILAASAEDVRFMWYSPTPMCLFNPIAHQLGNKGCSACEGLLSVDPLGRLLPCSSWPEPIGNLIEDGFENLWFSPRGVKLREKRAAHPDCRKCEHFSVCHGACPLYFQAHGYEELMPKLSELNSIVHTNHGV